MSQLNAIALVTLNELKNYIKVDTSDGDDKMTDIINRVSADCQNRWCRRFFIKDTYTEIQDGDGTNIIFLQQWPILTITSLIISVDGTALTEGVKEDYVFYESTGEIKLLKSNTERFPQAVTIVYDAGYETQSVLPDDLKLSVLMACSFQKKLQDNKRMNISSQQLQTQQTVYSNPPMAYPEFVQNVWNHYMRKRAT